MFENIKNGFKTANATRKLVFGDKELFAYPVISAILAIIAAIIVIALGVIAILAIGPLNGIESIILYVIVFVVLVFVITTLTTYFTIAMLIAFREHGKGKNISFSESLSRTNPYISLIIKWSVFYTIVYLIIHTIELAISRALSRSGIGGNIISGLITGGMNLALAAAVAFALPVIIDEKKGPIDTLKSSASFIYKNFGNTFGGLVFTELYYLIFLVIGLILIFVPLFVLTSASSPSLAFGLVLISIGIIFIIVGSLLRYVLFNCFKLILYDYKTKGTLPKGFDAKLLDGSVKKKGNQNDNPPKPSPFGFGMGQQGGL